MDDSTIHLTQQFLKYASDHHIIICPLPAHTSDVLQPLHVGLFKPLKHRYNDAVFEAISTGAASFDKVEFLGAFQGFHDKAFTSKAIVKSWEKTGHFPLNPRLVLDKIKATAAPPQPNHPGMWSDIDDSEASNESEASDDSKDNDYSEAKDDREGAPPARRSQTPPLQSTNSVERTRHKLRRVNEPTTRLLAAPDIPESIRTDALRLSKAALGDTYCNHLLEGYLKDIHAAERQGEEGAMETNYMVDAEGMIKAANAQSMNTERMEEEDGRQKPQEERERKRLAENEAQAQRLIEEENKEAAAQLGREAKAAQNAQRKYDLLQNKLFQEEEKAEKKRKREEAKTQREQEAQNKSKQPRRQVVSKPQ